MNGKAFLLLMWPTLVNAQGFGGLGTQAEGFEVPELGTEFSFPTDHGPHPEYRIEWWYLTANMIGPDGTDYGLQWTLFRSALAPEEKADWTSPQIWFGHAAVTTPEDHYFSERLARGGIGQAGANADPFEAWIDDWSLVGDWQTLDMTASGSEFSFDVELEAQGPLVYHGDEGYSVKSSQGQASYYYSQPYLSLVGTLTLPEGPVEVTGQAWIDREWSSQPLSDNQTGWDWFSLSFDGGDKLMGFRLRQDDGTYYTSATWIGADGATQAYPNGAFVAEPLNLHQSPGAAVPTQWQVSLADREIDVRVSALNPDAWMGTNLPYWEGPILIEGSRSGKGYLEMTGYE